MKRLIGQALLVAILTAPLAQAEHKTEVVIYSRITKEGKKLPVPTPEQPAYYLLVSGGYGEAGNLTGGEHPPPPELVEGLVRRALAERSYQGVTSKSPRIDMFIVYNWGYINPVVVSTFVEGQPNPRNPGEQPPLIEHKQVLNELQMLGLLGVASLDKHFATDDQVRAIASAAGDDRYFVVLSAYDWTAITHKERKLLWRAMMSLDSTGTNLAESLPALVTAGAPFLGRETGLPQQVVEPLVPPGKVEIGPTKFEEYLPTVRAEPPAPPDQSAKK